MPRNLRQKLLGLMRAKKIFSSVSFHGMSTKNGLPGNSRVMGNCRAFESLPTKTPGVPRGKPVYLCQCREANGAADLVMSSLSTPPMPLRRKKKCMKRPLIIGPSM